ncbi:MAG: thiamine pyrophosphate-binding protein [Candidatus Omnitrophota bacterium]
MLLTGSELLLQVLKNRGVRTIYGIVGREAEAISFNEIDGIDFILTHDERSAGYMADMQGRLTGNVGVCYSTFGPGASNLATGIASAYLDRSPVLAISAQVEKKFICPSTHQYLNQVALMRPITKYAKEITDINYLEEEIVKAIEIAEKDLPGPCFLSISWDVLKQKKNIQDIKRAEGILYQDMRCDARQRNDTPKDLICLLSKKNNPICIVGNDVARNGHAAKLSRFLKVLKLPAVTTYAAKGVVSCNHECYLGTVSKYLGYLTPGLLEEIFTEADLILLIGFDMVEGVDATLWQYGKEKKIVAINSLYAAASFASIDLEIQMSYPELFKALAKNVQQAKFSLDKIKKIRSKIEKIKNNSIRKQLVACKNGLNPFSIVNILNKTLSKNDILVSDVGLHKQFVSLFYEVKKPKTFFCSNGLGSMGFGLPAAMAAKSTFPDKRVIAVCGDGGFHISSCELETSVRCHLPIICIIFCDRSVGLIRHYQKKGLQRDNPDITNFGHIDFVKLAQANGCKAYQARTKEEFSRCLQSVLNTNTTAVIEVLLDRDEYSY